MAHLYDDFWGLNAYFNVYLNVYDVQGNVFLDVLHVLSNGFHDGFSDVFNELALAILDDLFNGPHDILGDECDCLERDELHDVLGDEYDC